MSLKENIKENEGFKSYIYQDTRGYPTVGYGFEVSSLSKDELFLNGGKVEPMSKVVADQILEMKLIKLIPSVCEAFPWLEDKPKNVQDVVIEMCYQMGVPKVKKFVTTLNFIKSGEYEAAYKNGLNSLWAKQTPNRAKKVLSGLLITKLPIVGFALAALLGFACVNSFLENSKLQSVNSVLLKDLQNVKEKNERLTGDYATAKNNLNACNVSLSLQNEAIKAAAVKIDDTPSKEAERIKKIYVKDKSCEAELAAYKELFRD